MESDNLVLLGEYDAEQLAKQLAKQLVGRRKKGEGKGKPDHLLDTSTCMRNVFMKNKNFVEACEKANLKPSPRQFSKFLRGKGIAYKSVTMPSDPVVMRQIQLNRSKVQ